MMPRVSAAALALASVLVAASLASAADSGAGSFSDADAGDVVDGDWGVGPVVVSSDGGNINDPQSTDIDSTGSARGMGVGGVTGGGSYQGSGSEGVGLPDGSQRSNDHHSDGAQEAGGRVVVSHGMPPVLVVAVVAACFAVAVATVVAAVVLMRHRRHQRRSVDAVTAVHARYNTSAVQSVCVMVRTMCVAGDDGAVCQLDDDDNTHGCGDECDAPAQRYGSALHRGADMDDVEMHWLEVGAPKPLHPARHGGSVPAPALPPMAPAAVTLQRSDSSAFATRSP
jgi:hypothetical protein